MRLRDWSFVLSAVGALSVGACGGDDKGASNTSADGGGGSENGGGRDALGQCSGETPSSCSASEVKAYGDCATSKCDSDYQKCLGDGYKKGSYSGLCGDYYKCLTACDCGDNTCLTDCGLPPSDCTQCLLTASQCTQDKCETPACFNAGDAGFAFDGSLPGSDKTCADLKTCCDSATTGKSDCTTAYDQAKPAGDFACGIVYTALSQNGTCN